MNPKVITAGPSRAAVSAGPEPRKKVRPRRPRRLRRRVAAFAAVCALTAGAAFTLAGPASADTASPAVVPPLDTTLPAIITVQNSTTGQCLEDDTAFVVSTTQCDGSTSQMWYTSGLGLTNVATGQCLDTDSPYDDIFTAPCTGAVSETFYANSLGNSLGYTIEDVQAFTFLASDQDGDAFMVPGGALPPGASSFWQLSAAGPAGS
jgi:hypothetical protein